MDPWVAVRRAGFEEEDAVAAGLAEAGGDGASGGTGAGDDVVKGLFRVWWWPVWWWPVWWWPVWWWPVWWWPVWWWQGGFPPVVARGWSP
jgi:hypothetical protein